MTGLLKALLAALRPGRSSFVDPRDLLDEEEKALHGLFPEGRPSGDGSAQFDRHIKRREAMLDWELTVRKWFQIAAVIATYVALAGAIAVVWAYFAA